MESRTTHQADWSHRRAPPPRAAVRHPPRPRRMRVGHGDVPLCTGALGRCLGFGKRVGGALRLRGTGRRPDHDRRVARRRGGRKRPDRADLARLHRRGRVLRHREEHRRGASRGGRRHRRPGARPGGQLLRRARPARHRRAPGLREQRLRVPVLDGQWRGRGRRRTARPGYRRRVHVARPGQPGRSIYLGRRAAHLGHEPGPDAQQHARHRYVGPHPGQPRRRADRVRAGRQAVHHQWRSEPARPVPEPDGRAGAGRHELHRRDPAPQ